jgi:hypothetical protein
MRIVCRVYEHRALVSTAPGSARMVLVRARERAARRKEKGCGSRVMFRMDTHEL